MAIYKSLHRVKKFKCVAYDTFFIRTLGWFYEI